MLSLFPTLDLSFRSLKLILEKNNGDNLHTTPNTLRIIFLSVILKIYSFYNQSIISVIITQISFDILIDKVRIFTKKKLD